MPSVTWTTWPEGEDSYRPGHGQPGMTPPRWRRNQGSWGSDQRVGRTRQPSQGIAVLGIVLALLRGTTAGFCQESPSPCLGPSITRTTAPRPPFRPHDAAWDDDIHPGCIGGMSPLPSCPAFSSRSPNRGIVSGQRHLGRTDTGQRGKLGQRRGNAQLPAPVTFARLRTVVEPVQVNQLGLSPDDRPPVTRRPRRIYHYH